MECLIKSFKKTIADNLYDFIVVDCNNNSLRSLNEFYCHSKDSGFVVSFTKFSFTDFFLQPKGAVSNSKTTADLFA